MCGIAGFVGRGDEKTLRAMTDVLAHRGPDGEGFFFDRHHHVGLGHRRLSVIDIQGGSQPLWNETKTVITIFNGEIYNYQRLRERLARNHHFATASDTEVIVHLYEDEGEEFLESLEGMFAIALWDARSEKLILARDRFGEKPLYVACRGASIVFASELKALFMHPDVTKTLNTEAIQRYFIYEYIPAPDTPFQDIIKLQPGGVAVYERGGLRTRSYYSILHKQSGGDETVVTETDAMRQLDKKLDAAVHARLISDVPLGVFLSGGVDSSTIAYYAQKHSSRPLKTFSIGFEERSFDESRWARGVARRLGTDHFEHVFTQQDFLDVLPNVFARLDEPLADASILPTYLLSRFTRERVTVALGGDGGDELFLGYPTFVAHRLWPFYHALPHVVQRYIAALVQRIPVSRAYFSLEFKLKKFIEGGHHDAFVRDYLWRSAFTPHQVEMLLTHDTTQRALEIDTAEYLKSTHGMDQLRALSYFYLSEYLANDILVKTDRASMLNSLELRSPFLDRDLAEFVFFLPTRFKLNLRTGKSLLRKLMAPRIGRNTVYRKKQGFSVPLSLWLARGLGGLTKEYLDSARIAREGVFRARFVERIMKEHMEGKEDHRKKIWSLLVFQIWRERHGV